MLQNTNKPGAESFKNAHLLQAILLSPDFIFHKRYVKVVLCCNQWFIFPANFLVTARGAILAPSPASFVKDPW